MLPALPLLIQGTGEWKGQSAQEASKGNSLATSVFERISWFAP